MVPPLSPEFLLAAACAMWPPSDRRTEAICAAAAGPLDWARFLRVVSRHRVLGLVHDGLNRARPDVPPEIAREISAQATTLLGESLAMAAEAVRLQRLFDDAGLPVLFLKGASLAVLAYGNLGLRSAKDIDLLVSPETLPPATALVTRAGYRRFDPPPNISDAQLRLLMSLRKDLGFIHQVTGLQIELHWRLFLNPHAMDEASVMAASRVVPLTGTDEDCARWARKISSPISACTARSTGGTSSNGLPISAPCLLPRRKAAPSGSIGPPKPGARGAPQPRPCCFASGFWVRPCPLPL